MNKNEAFEVEKTLRYGAVLGTEYVARALSALIRAARTKRSAEAIRAIVPENVESHPEFIV